jgi:hypothetical protein
MASLKSHAIGFYSYFSSTAGLQIGKNPAVTQGQPGPSPRGFHRTEIKSTVLINISFFKIVKS